MNSFNQSLLAVAALDFLLAATVWLRNFKNKINISLGATVFFIALWTLSVAFFKEATTVAEAWRWTWVQNGSGGLIFVAFYIFSVYFPYQSYRFKARHVLVILASTAIMLTVVLVPGAWTQEVILEPHRNDYLNNRWGLGYFALHAFTYLSIAFSLLVKKYKESSGFTRHQLSFVITATGITAFFGTLFGIVIPLILGRVGPYWMGPFFSLTMVILLFYFLLHFSRAQH